MKMKVMMCAFFFALVMSTANVALAIPIVLDGTLSGTDSNSIRDDGDGNHDYDMAARIPANTFYFPVGSPVTITGTVDVRALAGGSYLQIGLVDREQADLSLDTYNWGGYMFNNSAFATFYAGTRNYARLADNNDLYSGQLFNAPGTTPGMFDFTLDISGDGNMGLTLHGASDVSTTYTFGHRNWWDGWSGWSGGELQNGGYLIAQLWIDTGVTASSVSADYHVTATPVPEPMSMVILGCLSAGMLGARKLRRQK
ncbi:MAG: hypothetical protein HZB26_01835 [Candidatus Hydrogenedentes bacterium]|nr:hypothetical protein [Candidatus Hydrogenedentota bacterium]